MERLDRCGPGDRRRFLRVEHAVARHVQDRPRSDRRNPAHEEAPGPLRNRYPGTTGGCGSCTPCEAPRPWQIEELGDYARPSHAAAQVPMCPQYAHATRLLADRE